jgi:hypothetical protein
LRRSWIFVGISSNGVMVYWSRKRP